MSAVDATLVGLLERRAAEQGAARALTFLTDGETTEEHLTYAELDARARAIAATLVERGASGGRALLLYPPGLDYIAAFFGCQYANVTAVPAYPPDPGRLERTIPRLLAIVQDAQATVALTTAPILAMAEYVYRLAPALRELDWIATEGMISPAAHARLPQVGAESLAFLQYTSGSTGTPKGVMLTHANLLHNEALIQRAFAHDEHTVVVGWLPLYHDMGLIGNLLQPIYLGVPCVLMSPIAFLQRPMRWLQAIARYRATTSGGPNFAYDLCVRKSTPEERAALDLSSWKLAFNGAEPVRAETLERFAATFAASGFRKAAFYPCYGLAEATLIVSGGVAGRSPALRSVDRDALGAEGTALPAAGGAAFVSSGRVVGDQALNIVDPETRRTCPDGKVGEIWVRGGSVAQGYWGQRELSEETFGAQLSTGEGPYLRTGDLGFLDAGEVYITGRRKDLIILRGRNIYPQDLELSVEEIHPSLRPGCGAAFSVEEHGEERVVVVYEIDQRQRARRGAETNAVGGGERRKSDRRHLLLLPDLTHAQTGELVVERLVEAIRQVVSAQHEVQLSAVVLVKPGTVQKTSSGKIQRGATRADFLAGRLEEVAAWRLSRASSPTSDEVTAAAPLPAGIVGELLVLIAEVLERPVGELDPARAMSSYGMDSLASTQIAARIRTQFQVDFELGAILDARSTIALAERISSSRGEPLAVEPAIEVVPRSAPLLLSYAQERLWFLDQLEPGRGAYNIPAAVRLTGALDEGALKKSVRTLVARHECLRTRVAARDGVGYQIVDEACDVVFEVEDLTGLSTEERAWRVEERTQQEASWPFVLSEGPLLRVRLLRLSAHERVLLLTMHHIVSDGWSMGVLMQEMSKLYEADVRKGTPSLPALPVQYADYAAWQRKWLSGDELSRQVGYWKGALAGAPELLQLPTDRPRPSQQSHRGASLPVDLGTELSERVRALGQAQGVTPFMILFGGFSILLARYSRQRDVVVGTAIANRTRRELEGLIGFFVNTLALRMRLDPEHTVAELLASIKERTLDAYRHQDVPFEKVVDALSPERSLGHAPVFQVMIGLQKPPIGAQALPGVVLSAVEVGTTTAKFDLTLSMTDEPSRFVGTLEYATDLFERETVARMVGHLKRLLSEMCAGVAVKASELPMLSAAEVRQLVVEWNDTARDSPSSELVHELFAEQAGRRPHAIAVSSAVGTLTYGELDARSNQLARHLRKRGVGPDVLVGLCVERSLEMVVAVLAILKAGGAYVPLDPTYPRERLTFMLEEVSAQVLVGQERLASQLPSFDGARVLLEDDAWLAEPADPLGDPGHPLQAAYVNFTSGSTGKPKGVLVPHRAVVRLVRNTDYATLDERQVFVQFAQLSFDASTLELWGPLCNGGRLVVPPPGMLSLDELADLLIEERVSCFFVTTAIFHQLAAERTDALTAVDQVMTGGEVLSIAHMESVRAKMPAGRRLSAVYGPTENTTFTTHYPLRASIAHHQSVSLGSPIASSTAFVLDGQDYCVPVGVAGELCVAGNGLARGYLKRAELTAEKFAPNPHGAPGSRLYRTGDLARWLSNGTLEYLGRIDQQVKIRGFRIELGEVESALSDQAGVKEAVVVVREDVPGQKQLIAYLTGDVNVGALEVGLGERLPEYMMPAAFVILDVLPLTPNGKVDRKALPAPTFGGDEAEYVPPRNEVEDKLVRIWRELLRVPRVGVRDSFFDLGGDSILSIQMASRARAAGVHITLKQLFEQPRIEALAKLARGGVVVEAEQGLVTGPVELSPIEGWFFQHGEAEEPSHFNQAMLLDVRGQLDGEALDEALFYLAAQHDALRLRYRSIDGGWSKELSHELTPLPTARVDIAGLGEAAQDEALREHATTQQRGLDLTEGPLVRAALYELGARGRRLLLVVHHVAVDGVSWRVLLGDLEKAYAAARRGQPIALGAKTTSVRAWATKLSAWAQSEAAERELTFWRAQGGYTEIPRDQDGANVTADATTVSVSLTEVETEALLHDVPPVYRTQVNDALLLALVEAFEPWTRSGVLTLDLEGHGREALFDDVDLTRTVGWFTSLYPLRLDLSAATGTSERLKAIKEQLRAIPHHGIGYGALRYLGRPMVRAELSAHAAPEVSFNYLGQLDQALPPGSMFTAAEPSGDAHSPKRIRDHLVDVNAQVSGGRLGVAFTYGARIHDRATIKALAARFVASLREVVAHSRSPEAGGYTPSDFPLAKVDQPWLDREIGRGADVEDLYALSPMQEGMLFASLLEPASETYFVQVSVRLSGPLDVGALEQAWRAVLARHEILRTSFHWERLTRPVQVVHKGVDFALERRTLAGADEGTRAAELDALRRADRKRPFALGRAPLMRASLVALSDEQHELVWSFHHLLLDGWCLPIVMKEVLAAYGAYADGGAPGFVSSARYRDYIAWLGAQDDTEAEPYFRGLLAGFEAATSLGIAGGRVGARPKTIGERTLRLSSATTAQAKRVTSALGLTVNTLMQGAWGLLLGRYSATDDVVFGVVGSGRPAELVGIEHMVGLFINTLPVRVAIGEGARVADVLASLLAQQVETRKYEATPLMKVQGWSEVPQGQPLFESLFVFENYPLGETLAARDMVSAARLRLSNAENFEQTTFALALTVTPGEELSLRLQYDAERFEAPAVERLLEHYLRLVEAIVARPEAEARALPMLSEAETRRLLLERNDTAHDDPRAPIIHERFAEQAAKTPDAVALRFEAQTLTYRELDERSNQLAHHLRKRGVGPDVLVGVCVERSPEMVVGLLGILKAGGAYVPLDPAYPQERLRYMLEDSQVALLLTEARFVSRFAGQLAVCLDRDRRAIAEEPRTRPATGVRPSVAYVIYTSGSTGRPKGVVGLHRATTNRVDWMLRVLPFAADEVACQKTSLSFVDSIWEIFGPLFAGVSSTILADERVKDARLLVETLARDRVTRIVLVPSLLQALLAEHGDSLGGRLPRLRYCSVSGEALAVELAREFGRCVPNAVLINLYGSSEIAGDATAQLDVGAVSIGRPIDNTRVYVLDADQRLAADGLTGELYVAGHNLARGYLHRPALTAERFVPDAYAEPGSRMFRTGDLARWRPDGTLGYLGRVDHQVKVRGFRIELGEIEAALLEQAEVHDAVVLAREDAPGQKRLVGYVTGTADAAALKTALSTKLPEYMVPAVFVVLPALPLTPNGKVDRKALPAPEWKGAEAAYLAPRNELEERLVGVWKEVLRVERLGVRDDFFALGGHSLSAMQLTSLVRRTFDVELAVRAVFDAPTVERMGAHIGELRAVGRTIAAPIVRADRAGPLPLSYSQERLWFLDQMMPGTSVHNMPAVVRLGGALDVQALGGALRGLVRRHESLRTRFVARDGRGWQIVDHTNEVSLDVEALEALPAAERGARCEARVREEVERPFDLARGPLLRMKLFRLAREDHVLVFTMHHIVSDGWSMGVLVREVGQLYGAAVRGAQVELTPLPVQYADYALWQREHLSGEVLSGQLAYWKKALQGAPPVVSLPTDRPRPAQQSYRGASLAVELGVELSAKVHELARAEGATPFMVLLASVQLLLARYSGQRDVVVGTFVANRTRKEVEELIGFFVNTLAMRGDLTGEPSGRELVRRAKETTLAATANQAVPFERVVEALNPARSRSHTPVFQVMLVLQNAPATELALPGLVLSREPPRADQMAKFDLTFDLGEGAQGFAGTLTYAADLFDESTMKRLLANYLMLLGALTSTPELPALELQMLSAEEQRQQLLEWNDTARARKERLVHEVFTEQAGRTPDAIAVTYENEKLSYRDLGERSSRLARYLQKRGVGADVPVGICVERSMEMVVAVLGVLKAGGAYVPLDPRYPRERLAYMIGDAEARVVLTQERLREGLPGEVVCLDRDWAAIERENDRLPGNTRPDHLAYVIYTSGSTGRPKGVALSHRALVNVVEWSAREYVGGARTLQFASLSFDASFLEMFGTWQAGGTLVVVPEASRVDVGALHRLIAAEKVAHAQLPGVILQTLAEQAHDREAELTSLTRIATTGEQLQVNPAIVELFKKLPKCRLHNFYGPSETHGVTAHRLPDEPERFPVWVPIGKPIDNCKIYVLDERRAPVPVGVEGEVYIGGVALARGYARRPELTAERFVPSPFDSGARVYRTGDRARYLRDGTLEHLGRVDLQVKIRGFRIELGEVEAALLEQAGVSEAVVVAREDVSGQKRLVAYVTGDAEIGTLKRALEEKLPAYMVPSAFVALEALPLTVNGKVDRPALPAPERGAEAAFVAPRNQIEEQLASIWREVLHVERVGVRDNFFELGGHSLLATQLTSQVRQALEVELPVRDVFDAPTVEGLGQRVEALRVSGRSEGGVAAPIEIVARSGELELSYAQERLWFIDQLEPGSATYNLPAAVRLSGALDVRALERSLQDLVRRHESLRTRVVTKKGVGQQLIDDSMALALKVEDLRAVSDEVRAAKVRALTQDEAIRPFDLAMGPLLRTTLLLLSAEEHVLLLTMHHIVSDGWSMGVLVEDLGELYRARARSEEPRLSRLPVQYADYAAWQRNWQGGPAQLAYWKSALAGAPELLQLPTDRPRPAQQSYRGASVPVVLGTDLSAELNALCKARGLTPFMVLLGGFSLLLSRYSGQRDVVVGTPIANRTRRELEGLIGFFVNTLALRTEIGADDTIEALLGKAKERTLAAYAHQDLSFEKLVDALSPERSMAHAPLFQVMLVLQNAPVGAIALPDLVLSPVEVETTTAKFDLTLTLRETPAGFAGHLEYATDLFERATVERMGAHLTRVLEEMVARPTARALELDMLSAEEKRQLRGWNDAATYPTGALVHEQFATQAAKQPGAVAVSFEDASLTYGELDVRANQVAHLLRKRGVGADVLVGLCVERSLEMVVGLLGILKAGGAYLPLDPGYPKDRLTYMLADSGARLLLTQERLVSELPEHGAEVVCLDRDWPQVAKEPTNAPSHEARPENLAYVIYTSGSTGKPKGAQVTHDNVARLFPATGDWYRFGPSDVWTLFHSYAFDFSVWELWGALLYGGRVVVVPHWVARDAAALHALLVREKVTVLNQTPSAFYQLIRADEVVERSRELSLRAVIFGGEALDPKALLPWHERHRETPQLINMYGITETTVHVTYRPIGAAEMRGFGSVIGRAIPDLRVDVLDELGQLVPVGVAGEMQVAGAGLARGYLRRPDLTAERFVPTNDAAPGARRYRSGDLARRLSDGSLEYLGRMDLQVKIRGFRIELGEIEAALSERPGVREVVVLAREDVPGQRRLVGYVTGAVEAQALKQALQAKLPEYMVPAAIVVLPALPLTSNGKVDRLALPAPELGGDEAAYVAPRNEVEEKLASVWKEVLRVPRVGVRDNFFELGGDSILSIQVVSRARGAGVHITPKQLFEHPRVEELAKVATSRVTIDAGQGLVVGLAELSPIESWFFAHGIEEELHHYNQAVILDVKEALDDAALAQSLSMLVRHHDALRLRYRQVGGAWQKKLTGVLKPVAVERVDLASLSGAAQDDALRAHATTLQASLSLGDGPLLRACVYELGAKGRRLLLVIHHLAVDGVSWRILLSDLERGYEQAKDQKRIAHEAKTTSVKAWTKKLSAWAKGVEAARELAYWRAQAEVEVGHLPRDATGANLTSEAATYSVALSEAETEALLREVPPVYRTQVNDALLLALAESFERWTGSQTHRVDLEGHGREDLFADADLSRTVGWFTSLYPVLLDLSFAVGPGERLKVLKEQLRAIPRKGIGYGALRYLSRPETRAELGAHVAPEVSFNYLGQLDQALAADSPFALATEPVGDVHSGKRARDHLLDVTAQVIGGRLQIAFTYGKKVHRAATIEALAAHFVGSLRGLVVHCRSAEAGGYTPSDFPLARLEQAWLDAEVGRGQDVEDVYALSPMQEAMLFITLLDPETATSFEQQSMRLSGPLQVDALERAFRGLVERHEILRTSFSWKGLPKPVQLVHREVAFSLERADLGGVGEREREDELEKLRSVDRSRGFALDRAPLLRAVLVRLSDEVHQLIFSCHHILLDGWSMSAVLKELLDGYEARARGRAWTPPAAPRFRDYIAWLAEQGEQGAEAYFRGLLRGFGEPTRLGIARGQVGAQLKSRGERARHLSAIDTRRLERAAQSAGVTVNTFAQAAWAVLLARYSARKDVIFGVLGSGRPAELPGAEQMVGLFINMLPARVRLDDATPVRELLQALQAQQTETRRYESVSLAKVQTWSEVPRELPLFETLIVFQNFPVGELLKARQVDAASLRVVQAQAFEQTNYALGITVVPGEELGMRLQYDVGRFDDAAVEALLEHYGRLLVEMVARPDAAALSLPILSTSELVRMARWNDTARAQPTSLVHEIFAAQAQKTPWATAVELEGHVLSYEALEQRSNQLARHLRGRGVGRETRVGICVERSLDMIVGVLGILKAGAAYVPLDPEHPAERLAYMISDARVALLLTQERLLARLPDAPSVCVDRDAGTIGVEARTSVDVACSPEDVGYVIYTSGSTGRPKGVALPHRALVNVVEWSAREYLAGARVLQFASLSFDASFLEMFSAWRNGSTLVVVSEETRTDVAGLHRLIAARSVDVAQLPGLVLQTLAENAKGREAELVSLRRVATTGEQLLVNAAIVELFKRLPDCRLHNFYGPSETHGVTGYALPDDPERFPIWVPIGRPIDNCRTYVLDEGRAPVPVGVEGEIYIGGVALARGYLDRPELTAERFTPSAFDLGARLYRTGDRGRHLSDGALEHLGRVDLQVKIRGFRVELGEVEAVLAAQAGVREAVVIAREDGSGSKRLVAYFTGDGDVLALKQALEATLPGYMVPAMWVKLEAIPLTVNGKVDRRALPAPPGQTSSVASHVEPRTPIEEALAAIWRELLGVERVGVKESFFDAGGHSLLAMQLVSHVRKDFAVELPIRSVFAVPTVEGMASVIDTLLQRELDAMSKEDSRALATLMDGPVVE